MHRKPFAIGAESCLHLPISKEPRTKMSRTKKRNQDWQKKMHTASVNQNVSEVPKIKPLNGINDDPTWHRNMRCSLRLRDPLLLRLQPEPNGNSVGA